MVDAGSGDGEGAALLARSARRVVGLDYHRGALEQARQAHPDVVFVEADLAAPWPVADADMVVTLQVVEHFEDDDAFVERALASVRPGGTVLLTTPNRLQSFSENPHHVREYTAPELQALLERHGDDVQVQGVFGNERVAAFDARRRAEVEKWLRLDPLRLRERLPNWLVERAFGVLSTIVRRGASAGGDTDAAAPIRIEDFEVRAADPQELDEALDLLATVRRPG